MVKHAPSRQPARRFLLMIAASHGRPARRLRVGVVTVSIWNRFLLCESRRWRRNIHSSAVSNAASISHFIDPVHLRERADLHLGEPRPHSLRCFPC